jgi:hypothetical protein
MVGDERCIQDFVGNPEGKRSLGKLKRGWEDNMNTNFHAVRWGH